MKRQIHADPLPPLRPLSREAFIASPPRATWPVLVFALTGALICAWGGITMAIYGG